MSLRLTKTKSHPPTSLYRTHVPFPALWHISGRGLLGSWAHWLIFLPLSCGFCIWCAPNKPWGWMFTSYCLINVGMTTELSERASETFSLYLYHKCRRHWTGCVMMCNLPLTTTVVNSIKNDIHFKRHTQTHKAQVVPADASVWRCVKGLLLSSLRCLRAQGDGLYQSCRQQLLWTGQEEHGIRFPLGDMQGGRRLEEVRKVHEGAKTQTIRRDDEMEMWSRGKEDRCEGR